MSHAKTGQERTDGKVDELDTHEGNDHATEAVNQQVASQHLFSPHGLVGDAAHGQGDQAGDDDGIENKGRQDGAERCGQPHDVQYGHLREYHHEHGRDDGKVFGDVVGDTEGRQGTAGNEELLADLHHIQHLGRVGIQIHHIGSFLGGLRAAVHGDAHIGLGQGGSIVGAVAGHGDDLAGSLLGLDGADLVFGLAFGDEAVHAGFLGDGGCRQGVVTGAHDGLDADGPQAGKTFHQAGLDGVLEIDDPQDAFVGRDHQRRTALLGHKIDAEFQVRRDIAAFLAHKGADGVGGSLADAGAVRQVRAAHAGLGGEGSEDHLAGGGFALAGQLLAQFNDGLSFRGIVFQRAQHGIADQFVLVRAVHGQEVVRHTVAVGDGAGLVQDHGIHVTAHFHGLAGQGNDIEAGHTVHAGDTDGGKQTADGGGDQADGQGHQGGDGQGHAAVAGHGIQADHHDEEDDGQADQQGVQGDLVGRFLSGRAFHQGDHLVQERLAGVGGDADLEPVADHSGATGHRAEITAAFLEDGRGFTGDGGFVHRSHAFHHFAVVGDQFAGIDQHQIALFQFAGVDDFFGTIFAQQAGLHVALGLLQALGLGLAATFGHGFGEVGEQQGHQQDDRHDDVVRPQVFAAFAAKEIGGETQQQGHEEAHFHHEHDRVAHHVQGIQLGKSAHERGREDVRSDERGLSFIAHGSDPPSPTGSCVPRQGPG